MVLTSLVPWYQPRSYRNTNLAGITVPETLPLRAEIGPQERTAAHEDHDPELDMKEHYVTGKDYDLGEGEITRIIHTLLCNKLIPLGNLSYGADKKGQLVLLLSHKLGQFIFPLLVPFEDKLHRLYQRIRKR